MMIWKAISLGGLTLAVLAVGYVVLVVVAAAVLLWLLLQGESAVFGD